MAINFTVPYTWKLEDLIDALNSSPNKKNKITIPKFQRTLVWKKEQQKEFIDSIKKGFPIGAILLYKSTPDMQGNTIYNLIDGLQRSTAINQYLKAPTRFFDKSNLSEETINNIFSIIFSIKSDTDKELMINEIIKWITELKGFEESDGFSSFKLTTHLNKTINLNLDLPNTERLTDNFVSILRDIKEESNINHFEVPILVYTGEQYNLPTIFERLNSKGTQLSKYQIYAATWINYKSFQIANRNIIDGIKLKYDSLIEEGYDIENYDGTVKFFTSEFTTFEYLFGLGKYLTNKFQYLFSTSSKLEQEDSIGFNIMNICLGQTVDAMNKLPEKLAEYEVQKVENAIIDAIEIVFNCLKGHITLKMNKRTKNPIVHSEFQIISMIGKVFHSKYNQDLSAKPTWEEVEKKIKSNLTYHYLYDIVRGYWRGTGDAKAYELSFSDRYETTIKKANWDNILNEWFEYDLSKKEKLRVNIKNEAVLFYKYLYSYSLTAFEEISGIEFDIEHIIPVDKLKDIAGESGIPISAFPNLCLLDSGLNRKKGSLTYYQYMSNQVSSGELTEEQAEMEITNIEKYFHTTKIDLQFVDDDFTVENYVNFLKNRFEKIKKLFYSYNSIS